MNVHPARIVAGLGLAAGGIVVGVTALALVFAKVLVNAGLPVHPGDIATLDDAVALAPFIGGFAAANLVAGIGLLIGDPRGESVGVVAAVVGAAVGVSGLVLIVAGRDPFAPVASPTSFTDGLGIVGTFTVLYLLVLAALAIARRPVGRGRGVAA